MSTTTLPVLDTVSDADAVENESPFVSNEDLSGPRKAAVLLVVLGVDTASHVLKVMQDEEVERVSIEIARLRNIPSKVVEDVLIEYRNLSMARDHIARGGIAFARSALSTALGEQRAEEIMMRVEAAMEVSAFHLLQTVETAQLMNFLQGEHPQTAALILSHLNPRKAAEALAGLPKEQQGEIMYRLATMGKTSPELLEDIEQVIREQLGSVFGAELSATGGVGQAAAILNAASRATEQTVMDLLQERSDELADSVKRLMFVFDDLVRISDRDLQRLLAEVEQRDIVLSLKAVSTQLRDKIMSNVSERVAEAIKEELELLGKVRVRDVDEAQQRILETAQVLEAEEEILLTRSGEDSMI